jgi:proteasome lid subunit RPN8/RPN11
VSALALMKMTAHCKRGGDIEVMGMLQGYAKDDAFIVLDVFELPVEGTETRVNAQGGRETRKRRRVVSLASRIRLLVVGHRREHAEHESEVRGTVFSHRHRSDPDESRGKGGDWSVSDVSGWIHRARGAVDVE